jgi:hypothetical protein
MDLFRQWPSLPPEAQADPETIFRDGLRAAEGVIFNELWSMTVGLLSVDTPPGIDAAFASVGLQGNGLAGFWPPISISIYVRKHDRIYIGDLPPEVKFPPTVSCGVDLRAAMEIQDPIALRVLAKRCWDGGAKADPSIVAATRQAQKFIDDLAQP